MYLLTKDEMRLVDHKAIKEWAIPSLILMENAGRSLVEALFSIVPDLLNKRVTILAGNGNNGGDGLVMARHLHARGVSVAVFVVNEQDEVSEDHAVNREILSHLPIRVFDIKKIQQTKLIKAHLAHSDVIVDALLGTGLNRDVSALISEVIDLANQRQVMRIAVDCPSGLDADTGKCLGNAFSAVHTLTLAYPQIGFYQAGAEEKTGTVHVLDIGIPKEVADTCLLRNRLLDEAFLRACLQPRDQEVHKHQLGEVGVIAGALGTGGAAVLCMSAALRSGCGLVRGLVDKRVFTPVSTALPEAMIRPVTWPNKAALDWLIDASSVLLVGPGLGTGKAEKDVLTYLLTNTDKPLVLDADALTLLSTMEPALLDRYPGELILTPHPGEMGRLIGKHSSEVQKNRMAIARDFAQAHRLTLVLKGHHTIIAEQAGTLYLNDQDSPALATAGSGDVLAGMIASFLANGLTAPQAAACGVMIHGMSGMASEESLGCAATIAGDIINHIPSILKKYI